MTVPGQDELVRLAAKALGALGELLEPGDPLRASLLIAARTPGYAGTGDTFDEQPPQEWQRLAWRFAIALLLTAGSAAGGALDGRVADAIQSATGCRVPMVFAGHDFAAPRRRNTSGWTAAAAVLAAGLRYEGFETCGCGREPKFRPRTSAQVRQRRRLAARRGVPIAAMLASRDPYGAD